MSGAPTVEPFCVADTFVTGAGQLQFMGDNVRLTLFVLQRSTYDGGTENAVVSKLVASRADMLKIAADILKACHAHAPKDKIQDAFVEFLQGPTGRH